MRCQSIWQWNAQTRAEFRSVRVLGTDLRAGVLIWIVRYEAKSYVTTRIYLDDVTAYGSGWRVYRCSTVDTGVDCGALYYLEVVAV